MQVVILKEKNSLFFNNFKVFIIQILYLIYLLDYLGDIIKENIYCRYKIMILRTVSGIRLFLGLRFYLKFFFLDFFIFF